jgi:hypothetical protein
MVPVEMPDFVGQQASELLVVVLLETAVPDDDRADTDTAYGRKEYEATFVCDECGATTLSIEDAPDGALCVCPSCPNWGMILVSRNGDGELTLHSHRSPFSIETFSAGSY